MIVRPPLCAVGIHDWNFAYCEIFQRFWIEYVDFIFYPEVDRSTDCIILELKVDYTPEEAVGQIKEKEICPKILRKDRVRIKIYRKGACSWD